MRILGIDYGDRKIGLSVSDIFGWTAQGIETLKWNENIESVLLRIKQLIQEYNITRIVVGFPINMDGTLGARAIKTQEFIDVLLENFNKIEVVKWDERLTTVSAKRAMQEMGVKKNKKRDLEDKIASTYLLQSYLDSIGKSSSIS